MADRLISGVLLVGGASERFGSPKALALFRGETLAERAWRTLDEVCDEVIAVGKAGDGLGLPFPVLDDGATEHAPIFGVLAGLRAAAHDACLVLPVDMPLVTPHLLRVLLREGAVPQTGPLPGAYTRSLLPALEERVAAGELALWGVGLNTVEVDERALANVNTRTDLIAAAVADWAASRDDVRAAVVLGSHARDESPADRWSDLDIDLVVSDLEPFVGLDWIGEFGSPALTVLERTPLGYRRRILYEAGEEVDFSLLPLAVADRLEANPDYARLLARGFRVLVDKIGLTERLHAHAARVVPRDSPSPTALVELASDFWFHALWTAKKVRRGEVFVAIECLDGYLKSRLVILLELHALAVDPAVETWHGGRFLERWADPGALAALERAYAHYDMRDVARALWETVDLFQGLAEETARRLGVELGLDHPGLRNRLSAIVPDPRRATLRG